MAALLETFRSFTESDAVMTLRKTFEAALFRAPEKQPATTWKLIFDPPLPYALTLFCQACRIISLLILLPIFVVTALDFAGYAVFRTLGLHRRRVRISRQSQKAGVPVPVSRSSSARRKPRIYQNDRHRPTDRSNIPSIVKAPLLSPGTYDAETLLRQRARSLSSASAEEEAAWIASAGQQARLSTLNRNEADLTSPDGDLQSLPDLDSPRDYFGRAPRVGVDGPLGLPDTDIDESGTESGRDSPIRQFSSSGRRRGLNFTPVSTDKPSQSIAAATMTESAEAGSNQAEPSASAYNPSVVSVSSSGSPSSSNNGDRHSSKLSANSGNDDGTSSNMSSSWIGVDGEDITVAAPAVNPVNAAAAAGLESESSLWASTDTSAAQK
ncbi:hypothetical protein BCV70DRAFT_111446 [Testicularia cyperi]|uniref:Uncharacterized protein n=1 Tax=Testicularia cyperi TaxID=1882483 RepID=A0A317XN41_9BASI|nr:hypothetical protein BCV70DRAFT_111446 [Testicularia cyperi]